MDERSDAALVIRDVGPNDVEAAAVLIGRLGYSHDIAAVGARIARLGGDPAPRLLVAERGGELLGLAALHVVPLVEHDEPICQLIALVIAERQRGQGIGGRLVEAVEAEALARGCYGVMLTSGNWRDEAHVFYRGRGYVETGRRFVKEFHQE